VGCWSRSAGSLGAWLGLRGRRVDVESGLRRRWEREFCTREGSGIGGIVATVMAASHCWRMGRLFVG